MRRIATLIVIVALAVAAAAAQSQPASQPNPVLKGVLTTLEQQLDPQITALLVIDMQNDYIADNGKLGQTGADVKRIQASIPALNNLVMEARKAGVMVIWVRQTHSFKDSLASYLARGMARVKDRPLLESDLNVQEGTWGADYYPTVTKRLDGEIEVIKHTYGGFINTPLDTYLKARGIKTLLNSGTLSNACVLSTAMQGYFLGYYSMISADSSSSNDPALHQATLTNFSGFFGQTPTNQQVIAIWKKYAGARAAMGQP